jgi:hypothetical protein
MATERFLYRTTPKGKIHFSWGVSHSWGSTTIRVGNGCNILGLDVETEGWKDGIVKMTSEEWEQAIKDGKVCKKCLEDLRTYERMDFVSKFVQLAYETPLEHYPNE